MVAMKEDLLGGGREEGGGGLVTVDEGVEF
jgi:hypothetical protein